jgi:hypothetical protein
VVWTQTIVAGLCSRGAVGTSPDVSRFDVRRIHRWMQVYTGQIYRTAARRSARRIGKTVRVDL